MSPFFNFSFQIFVWILILHLTVLENLMSRSNDDVATKEVSDVCRRKRGCWNFFLPFCGFQQPMMSHQPHMISNHFFALQQNYEIFPLNCCVFNGPVRGIWSLIRMKFFVYRFTIVGHSLAGNSSSSLSLSEHNIVVEFSFLFHFHVFRANFFGLFPKFYNILLLRPTISYKTNFHSPNLKKYKLMIGNSISFHLEKLFPTLKAKITQVFQCVVSDVLSK